MTRDLEDDYPREPIRILVTRVGTRLEGLEARVLEQTTASNKLSDSVNGLPEKIRLTIYDPLDKRLAAVEKDLASAKGAIKFIQIVGGLGAAGVAVLVPLSNLLAKG